MKFGTITFTSAHATAINGTVYSPSGAGLVSMKQGDEVLTSVSLTSDETTVNITRLNTCDNKPVTFVGETSKLWPFIPMVVFVWIS